MYCFFLKKLYFLTSYILNVIIDINVVSTIQDEYDFHDSKIKNIKKNNFPFIKKRSKRNGTFNGIS